MYRYENTHDHEGNLRHLAFNLETGLAAIVRNNKRVDRDQQNESFVHQWVFVMDFQGYSMWNAPPLKTTIATLRMLQNHYPNCLGLALIVDAPFAFNAVWHVISPLINHVTRHKIKFVSRGSLMDGELSEVVQGSDIEEEYGGSTSHEFNREEYIVWAAELISLHEKESLFPI